MVSAVSNLLCKLILFSRILNNNNIYLKIRIMYFVSRSIFKISTTWFVVKKARVSSPIFDTNAIADTLISSRHFVMQELDKYVFVASDIPK